PALSGASLAHGRRKAGGYGSSGGTAPVRRVNARALEVTQPREIGFTRVERAGPLRRIAEAPLRDGDRGYGHDVRMGVRAVDRGSGAGIARATPPIGAVGAAIPGREEHVRAGRDERAGNLIERMVGIGGVVLRRADGCVAGAVEQPPAV